MNEVSGKRTGYFFIYTGILYQFRKCVESNLIIKLRKTKNIYTDKMRFHGLLCCLLLKYTGKTSEAN
jgi:hypothetical protein